MKKLFYLLALALFLSSCTDTETSSGFNDDTLSAPDTVTDITGPTSTLKEHAVNLAELNEWTAFKLTYGTAATDNNKELLCALKNEGTESYDGYHHIQLDTLVPYTDKNGVEYAVATFKSKKYTSPNAAEGEGEFASCHGCGAIVGIGMYRKINGMWSNVQSNPILGNYGAWGEAPNSMGVQIFDQKAFVTFSVGSTGQGYSVSVDYLIWLDEKFPITEKRLFQIDSHGDNLGVVEEGEGDSYEWNAFLNLTKDGNKIYLEVQNKGTNIEDGLLIDITGKEFYVLNEKGGYFEVER